MLDKKILDKLLFSLVQNAQEKPSIEIMRIAKKLKVLGANPAVPICFAYALENGKSGRYATSVVESYSTALNEAKGDLKIYLSGLSAKY